MERCAVDLSELMAPLLVEVCELVGQVNFNYGFT